MDLRQYFRKIRDIEATIPTAHAFVVSLDTADGGKAGQVTETSRYIAAKLVAEGKATLASREEAERFVARQTEQREAQEAAEAAKRIQVTIVSERPGTQGKSGGQTIVKR